ncbi:calcium-binding protein, partial [Magnetovibrio sp.]|uniref:beta strand repeat-containing protein n=1 Tax=Magnetovibrio sp. TaxID=2024836 RepID=UPI002F9327F3
MSVSTASLGIQPGDFGEGVPIPSSISVSYNYSGSYSGSFAADAGGNVSGTVTVTVTYTASTAYGSISDGFSGSAPLTGTFPNFSFTMGTPAGTASYSGTLNDTGTAIVGTSTIGAINFGDQTIATPDTPLTIDPTNPINPLTLPTGVTIVGDIINSSVSTLPDLSTSLSGGVTSFVQSSAITILKNETKSVLDNKLWDIFKASIPTEAGAYATAAQNSLSFGETMIANVDKAWKLVGEGMQLIIDTAGGTNASQAQVDAYWDKIQNVGGEIVIDSLKAAAGAVGLPGAPFDALKMYLGISSTSTGANPAVQFGAWGDQSGVPTMGPRPSDPTTLVSYIGDGNGSFGDANDISYGGPINNTMNLGNGINYGYGGGGNDTITSGNNSDFLDGGTGADIMAGGGGNDTYIVDNVDDQVQEQSGLGIDTVKTSVTYTLPANVDNLTLTGSGGTSGTGNALNNVMTGNAGDNTLSGGGGNDTLVGGEGLGNDIYDGGDDIDTIIYSSATNPVNISLATGIASGIDIDNDTLINIENVVGGSGADAIAGDAGPNVISGGAGNDLMDGRGGNDTLTGGVGSDTISGGAGTDTATFSGTMSGYVFSSNSSGWSITDTETSASGDDGTDMLAAIETMSFTDGDITASLSNYGETRVNEYSSGYQMGPALAGLSGGGFAIAWSSYGQDGNNYGVYGKLYDTTGYEIDSEFRINSSTLNSQRDVSIAALLDGGFVVTWNSDGQDGDGNGVYGQRFTASGATVGAQFRINTTTLADQDSSSVASLSDGGYVVAWESFRQDHPVTGNGIYGQRYDVNGNAAGSEFLINTYITDDQATPSVAGLSGGGFVVVWQSNGQDSDGLGIYAQRFNADGSANGTEFVINTFTAGSQERPAVASLSTGGFVVTWQSANQDGNSAGVYGQLYDPSANPVGTEFQVNTNTVGLQIDPSVVSLSDGGFVITWTSQTGEATAGSGGFGVFGQRYDASGNPVGSEFQVNTTMLGDQTSSTVGALSDGGFAVAWSTPDSSLLGVDLQRFTSSGLTAQTPTLAGGAQNDVITAGGGPQAIYGNAGQDILSGGADNDYLDGGTGNDILKGGAGDDTMMCDTAADQVDGGDGTDTADYSAVASGLSIDLLYSGSAVI